MLLACSCSSATNGPPSQPSAANTAGSAAEPCQDGPLSEFCNTARRQLNPLQTCPAQPNAASDLAWKLGSLSETSNNSCGGVSVRVYVSMTEFAEYHYGGNGLLIGGSVSSVSGCAGAQHYGMACTRSPQAVPSNGGSLQP